MSLISLFTLCAQLVAPYTGPAEATILFAGDAMQHGPQLNAARQSDGSYLYDDCFEAISPIINEADYSVVNLETPVGNRTFSGYPCFSAPVSYATALQNAGFDFCLTANNHTLDRSDYGLKRTISVLDSIGMSHIGTYNNEEHRSQSLPKIVTINGFHVGFLNYTYGTNGIEVKGDVVVDYIDRDRIAADIRASREAGAEILCVAMHWGEEYLLLPPRHVVSDAEFLKEQGVDIIFGGHPHVIQPMELTINPVNNKNCALFYSLGNFISNMQKVDTRGGALARVTLKRNEKGEAYVDALSYRLIFTVPGRKGGPNYVVYPAESTEITGEYATLRDSFVSRAENIFNNHNVNITSW